MSEYVANFILADESQVRFHAFLAEHGKGIYRIGFERIEGDPGLVEALYEACEDLGNVLGRTGNCIQLNDTIVLHATLYAYDEEVEWPPLTQFSWEVDVDMGRGQ